MLGRYHLFNNPALDFLYAMSRRSPPQLFQPKNGNNNPTIDNRKISGRHCFPLDNLDNSATI
jgi:hypothetical protein